MLRLESVHFDSLFTRMVVELYFSFQRETPKIMYHIIEERQSIWQWGNLNLPFQISTKSLN